MKLSEQVKKAIGALSAQELAKLRDEQGVKDWEVVDRLPEQEAVESLVEDLDGDELEAVQSIIAEDPDRVADRLSAIQQRVIQSDDLSDETRDVLLERLSATAEKIGVELPEVLETTEEKATEGAEPESDKEPETEDEPVPEPAAKESEGPTAAELDEARDHLDDKVAAVRESGKYTDEAVDLVVGTIKPRIRQGEALTAEEIAAAFDEELSSIDRAAESMRSKYETQFPTGETGKHLSRAKESDEDALAAHI